MSWIFHSFAEALVEHVDFLQANLAAKAAVEAISRRVSEQLKSWDRGRFTVQNGEFTVKNCDFTIKDRDSAVKNGDYTVAN